MEKAEDDRGERWERNGICKFVLFTTNTHIALVGFLSFLFPTHPLVKEQPDVVKEAADSFLLTLSKKSEGRRGIRRGHLPSFLFLRGERREERQLMPQHKVIPHRLQPPGKKRGGGVPSYAGGEEYMDFFPRKSGGRRKRKSRRERKKKKNGDYFGKD